MTYPPFIQKDWWHHLKHITVLCKSFTGNITIRSHTRSTYKCKWWGYCLEGVCDSRCLDMKSERSGEKWVKIKLPVSWQIMSHNPFCLFLLEPAQRGSGHKYLSFYHEGRYPGSPPTMHCARGEGQWIGWPDDLDYSLFLFLSHTNMQAAAMMLLYITCAGIISLLMGRLT